VVPPVDDDEILEAACNEQLPRPEEIRTRGSGLTLA
jgi:hypothetical protein